MDKFDLNAVIETTNELRIRLENLPPKVQEMFENNKNTGWDGIHKSQVALKHLDSVLSNAEQKVVVYFQRHNPSKPKQFGRDRLINKLSGLFLSYTDYNETKMQKSDRHKFINEVLFLAGEKMSLKQSALKRILDNSPALPQ